MKKLPWVLSAILFLSLLASLLVDSNKTTKVEERDTIIQIDTVRDTVPNTVLVKFDHWDTVYLPVIVDSVEVDTIILHDSVKVAVPIETKEYKTENYRAIISGYRPNLAFMEVYNTTKTITINPKKKRWGLGLQTGYGYPCGWYVGAGISYNIFSW